MTPKAFIDASVLFAAAYSPRGSAYQLLRQALEGAINILVSEDVLAEVRRNLEAKAPETLADCELLVEMLPLTIIDDPTPEAIKRVSRYLNPKDAIILAAAMAAQPDYFVTWDRKHFLSDPAIAEKSGLTIITPDDLLTAIGKR
jgi:putative PIN family toxin of toxin-antitoxin system